MQAIEEIIIHCSATPEGREIDAKTIDQWHKKQGWSMIGYHYVIKLNGEIEKGREETKQGAHVKGKNSNTLGICYIGGCDSNMQPKDTRTEEQITALKDLIIDICSRHNIKHISGHNEYSSKACPSFNVKEWVSHQEEILNLIK